MSTRLTIAAAAAEDAGRGMARIDPATLAALGGSTGALLAVTGERTAYLRAVPQQPNQRAEALLQLDLASRGNVRATVGDAVNVALCCFATEVRDVRLSGPPGLAAPMLRRILAGVPLCAGDHFRLPLINGREAELQVLSVTPDGPGLVTEETLVEIVTQTLGAGQGPDAGTRYEDLGGLGRVVERLRELVELAPRHPAVFAHLNITPPRGVLLVGPPGTGKTMLARAVAAETRAHFITVSGPDIVNKYSGESEQQLRSVFEMARQHAPAIIFIDEIDAIAHKHDAHSGEKQVERRIGATLLTLMDGLAGRGEVIVLGATNLPDAIDPALRRPGRFDREIRVDPPDREARREILAVHTRGMPLGPDVDLPALAATTHGHVGADLAALCREAAMAALRRAGGLALLTGPPNSSPDLAALRVEERDFQAALHEVTPSALREVFVEVPDVRWHDVAGMDGLRETLIRAVQQSLADPGRFARMGVQPPRGVLLHGRPGIGKTLIAQALATEAQAGFISIRAPELLTGRRGASERALRESFVRARAAAPCILFFDDIDAIAARRGSGGGAMVERLVAQLLTEMDGITQSGGVVVLAATNRPDLIDPALLRPGRFDLVLEMPIPDRAARAAMLGVHVRRMPLDDDVDLAALAQATEDFVGAEIAGLCRLAALAALARDAQTAEPRVTRADFATALQEHKDGRTWRR